MKSCNRSKMTQKTILLGAALLMACSFGKSQGFFLNSLLETTTNENPISSTSSPDISIADNNLTRFDEFHRNVSEQFEESSTQIVNSVKDILSLVLDEHSVYNQTQENNKNQVVTDSDNDIPSAEALVTNLKLDSDDPPLSIVQIPESDNEDVATALEDSIRSSVKDEIQLEQNFDTSAIDNIPDPDVRQTLTEEMMAIDYPQGVKKSEESKQTLPIEEDKIGLKAAPIEDLTEVVVSDSSQAPNTTVSPITTPTSTTTPVISTTTVAASTTIPTTTAIPTTPLTATTTAILTTTSAPKVEISDVVIDNAEITVGTTVPEVETLILAHAKVTTPTIEIYQEITLIPTEEIVHDVMEPQDNLETNPTLTRQMRGFTEESETNETSSDSLDSTEKEESSKSKSDSSNSSENSSVSSDSSSKESSVLDENVAAEESEDADAAISQDASIEDNFEKETPIAAELVPSKRVTPTPRPAILSTIDFTDLPIEIEGITESSGDLLTEATVTSGDGKHIVMKKPGVEVEFSWSNSTGKSILESEEVPAEAAQDEPSVKSAAEAGTGVDPVVNYVQNAADTQVHYPVTETSVTANLSTIVDTLHKNSLLDEKNFLTADSDIKPIDLDSLNTGSPLENAQRTLKNTLDNKTEQATETVTVVDHTSIQTHIPDVEGEAFVSLVDKKKEENNNELDHKHTSEIEPKIEQRNITFSQMPTTDNLQRTLNVEPALGIDEEKLNRTAAAEQSLEPPSVSPGQQLDTDRLSAAIPRTQPETEQQSDSVIAGYTTEISSTLQPSASQTPLDSEYLQTSSVENSTEPPTVFIDELFNLKEATTNADINATSKTNEISKHIDEVAPNHRPELSSTPKPYEEELDSITYESSTEKPIGRSNADDDATTPALVKTLIEAAELTTEFARHVDSFRTSREETSAISDEIVSPASAGRSFNTIIAEGLGKALPTRSVGDEPSTSSYSSEDKTTTVVVLCSAAALIFVAFSIAMYLITFQRQHGTLDIEMQEQHCGKDDLEDDDDAETRVTLLNQSPPVDSDEHSFD